MFSDKEKYIKQGNSSENCSITCIGACLSCLKHILLFNSALYRLDFELQLRSDAHFCHLFFLMEAESTFRLLPAKNQISRHTPAAAVYLAQNRFADSEH